MRSEALIRLNGNTARLNRLPRKVIMASSLAEVKDCLDSTGTQWDSWGCPVQGQELGDMLLVSAFTLRMFYDSTS